VLYAMLDELRDAVDANYATSATDCESALTHKREVGANTG